MAVFGNGWDFLAASPAQHCTGRATPCSYHSVASRKSSRWHAHKKPYSTGTVQYSRDCKVSSAGIEVRTGRKWKVEKAVEVAESCLRQKALVGTLATGRAGLGYFPKTQVGKAKGKERHHLLQEEVRAGVEEEGVSRAVGFRQQGVWTRWEITLQRRITWSNLMQADFFRVQFRVQAVYDALPSPANLYV